MENNQANNSTKPQIIVAHYTKSVGISILLTLLFGSVGLFYSTISGGLIMTLLFSPGIIILLFTGHFLSAGLLALLYYPICVIWGMRAVATYNHKLLNGEDTAENIDYQFYDFIQFLLICAFYFCATYAIYDIFFK